jgi:hypothetical protein
VTYYGWHELPQGLWIFNEYFKYIYIYKLYILYINILNLVWLIFWVSRCLSSDYVLYYIFYISNILSPIKEEQVITSSQSQWGYSIHEQVADRWWVHLKSNKLLVDFVSDFVWAWWTNSQCGFIYRIKLWKYPLDETDVNL